MFDFLRQKKDEQPLDVKSIRHRLVNFIKEQLQRWEGGEGGSIRGMQLFLSPSADERRLYETAVYHEEAQRFKEEEVQRIADDYAIDLPHDWMMDLLFVEDLPEDAIKARDVAAALHVVTNKQPIINKPATAYLKVLAGEAEKEQYVIENTSGRICIGRDHQTQTAEGFFRTNDIAFPGESQNPGNKYISRQHAHIEWNPEAGAFFLYADEGGIPPRNKVKVRTPDGNMIKLQTQEFGYELKEGDQVIVGESALLEFSYLEKE
jgi:hypothetical protein